MVREKKDIYMDLSLNYFYKTSQIISLLLLQVCCLRRLNFTEFKRKVVTSKFDKFRALLRTKQVFWNWLSELQSIKVYETYFCLVERLVTLNKMIVLIFNWVDERC